MEAETQPHCMHGLPNRHFRSGVATLYFRHQARPFGRRQMVCHVQNYAARLYQQIILASRPRPSLGCVREIYKSVSGR
jgi:hypothetical protein